MENEREARNVEELLHKNKVLIPGIPKNCLLMQVRRGSTITLLLKYALNKFPDSKSVIWTGVGTSVGKAITCAEIMKKEYKNSLHQITKICYQKVDESCRDPLSLALDESNVKRKIPMILIYLSSEKLKEQELGYQAPGEVKIYKGPNKSNILNNHNRNRNNKQNKTLKYDERNGNM
ncbi:unnamed protein product [Ceutorhynchus assimilis]|uniref:DNA/RNA-binding protein Alba-like domain-containing protein n=1 Tax=Ceutorhynchus assimilis TaxID=467358 RepID=A0A9N9Q8A2_9CUCU|nr:unnamed protein product [Ceutorhynchus assimilis]